MVAHDQGGSSEAGQKDLDSGSALKIDSVGCTIAVFIVIKVNLRPKKNLKTCKV